VSRRLIAVRATGLTVLRLTRPPPTRLFDDTVALSAKIVNIRHEYAHFGCNLADTPGNSIADVADMRYTSASP
jgi:hypothetical protein